MVIIDIQLERVVYHRHGVRAMKVSVTWAEMLVEAITLHHTTVREVIIPVEMSILVGSIILVVVAAAVVPAADHQVVHVQHQPAIMGTKEEVSNKIHIKPSCTSQSQIRKHEFKCSDLANCSLILAKIWPIHTILNLKKKQIPFRPKIMFILHTHTPKQIKKQYSNVKQFYFSFAIMFCLCSL